MISKSTFICDVCQQISNNLWSWLRNELTMASARIRHNWNNGQSFIIPQKMFAQLKNMKRKLQASDISERNCTITFPLCLRVTIPSTSLLVVSAKDICFARKYVMCWGEYCCLAGFQEVLPSWIKTYNISHVTMGFPGKQKYIRFCFNSTSGRLVWSDMRRPRKEIVLRSYTGRYSVFRHNCRLNILSR